MEKINYIFSQHYTKDQIIPLEELIFESLY